MIIYRIRRPKLNKIDLKKALHDITVPGFHITMSIGQWDNLLDEAYYRQDATLIELNDKGFPAAAYKLEPKKEDNEA